jgi:hypothetical protein
MKELKTIPERVTVLCDALNAVGIKSHIGDVNWADGDKGFVIHAGENSDDLLQEVDGKWTAIGTIDVSLFSLSFRSDGTLWDYEDSHVYKSFNPQDK